MIRLAYDQYECFCVPIVSDYVIKIRYVSLNISGDPCRSARSEQLKDHKRHQSRYFLTIHIRREMVRSSYNDNIVVRCVSYNLLDHVDGPIQSHISPYLVTSLGAGSGENCLGTAIFTAIQNTVIIRRVGS